MDAPTAFYIVVFIAVLNVIAFTSVNDWKSVVFMVLAGGACYAITPDRTLALVVGIIASNLYRASSSMQEGMAKKDEEEEKLPVEDPAEPAAAPAEPAKAEAEGDEGFGNFGNMDIKGLMAKQMQLMAGIKGMAPLLVQAQKTMSQLPKGFLKQAMKKLNFENKNL